MPLLPAFAAEPMLSSWRTVVNLVRPMAGWTLLVWGLLTLVLAPAASALLGRYVLHGDHVVVGNEDLVLWLLSPGGIIYVLLSGSLLLSGVVIRYAGLFQLVLDDIHGHRPGLARTILALLPRFPALLHLCLAAVLTAAALFVPLIAGLAAIYAAMLGEYDINYYLRLHPPEWRAALGAGSVWAVIWAAATVYCAGRLLLALPAYLDGYRPLRRAVRETLHRTHGRVGRLLHIVAFALAAWLLVRFTLDAMLVAVGGWSVDRIAALSGSLDTTMLATGLFAMIFLLFDAAVAFLGFAFLATVLTRVYLKNTVLQSTVPVRRGLPGHPLAVLRRWLHPARLLVVALALLAAGTAGSVYLLPAAPELRPVIITAHRAGPRPAPENTLDALERGIAAGADMAEIDVQRTRDDVVVVVHDADLMRVAADPRRIEDTDYTEMTGLVQRPDDGTPVEERRIATLAEFLDRSAGRVGLKIELKYYHPDSGLAPAVIDEVRARGRQDDVAITSLNLRALQQVRELAPEIRVGYIATVTVGNLSELPVNFLLVPRRLATPRLIGQARRRGIHIDAWPVNRADQIAEYMERGVDGIVTDDPELALRVRDTLMELPPSGRLLVRFHGLLLDNKI